MTQILSDVITLWKSIVVTPKHSTLIEYSNEERPPPGIHNPSDAQKYKVKECNETLKITVIY